MKIAVAAAAGKAGKAVTEEAVRRGHSVTGFVRSAASALPAGAKKVVKDLFSLTREDLAPFDVVVDAFGAWTEDTLPQHSTSLKHLADALAGTTTRLIVVGGAGSLYADKAHTVQLLNTPNFPDAFKPLAAAMGTALDALRTREDIVWTYFSPAPDFRPDGPRTGKYLLGGEEAIANVAGESFISYADYAAALLDEAENGRYLQKRFTAVTA